MTATPCGSAPPKAGVQVMMAECLMCPFRNGGAEFEEVPNAPKSSISEIFNNETTDGASPSKGSPQRPRVVRDTPTRPRDTHSRLFGQVMASPPAPMMTDTIRSHIQFGEQHCNGVSTPTSNSPTKLTNGSASSTPSREGNPITGDGYKSMNGEINTVTGLHDRSSILHNRVPPGGFSSGLW